MKRGRSTGKPTAAESARIVACKLGPCVACIKHFGWNGSFVVHGCDYHHTLSGGIRRGHMFGMALCPWHHRRIPPDNCAIKTARDFWGPSLMDGSRLFREAYGSDDELLELQDQILQGAMT